MEEISLVIRSFPRLAILAVLPMLLGGYYIFVTDASLSSKSIVAVLLVLSLIALFVVPAYWLWVLLLQVAIGIYIVFYLAWTRE